MADKVQLGILRRGVVSWNKWREVNPDAIIDLSGANLQAASLKGANLEDANLHRVDLSHGNLEEANLVGADLFKSILKDADLRKTDCYEAILCEANLYEANLKEADLSRANLTGVDLFGADLSEAKLIETRLVGADLSRADLSGADLSGADFSGAKLIEANLSGADLNGTNLTGADLTSATLIHSILIHTEISNARISKSKIYGVSVWDLIGEFTEQNELIITPDKESIITVDNIKIAQFVYLILNNKEIRDVINTLTSKTVLILGRFSLPERKGILDALRAKLREFNLLPIVFDFDRPTDKDFTETIKTLAGISFFVIADVTNPKSSPLELQATIPDYQIPFVPIIQEGEEQFSMMVDLQKKYNWVLKTRTYNSIETLIKALKPGIIDPAMEMRNKLRLIKAQEKTTESLTDYLNKKL
jgi:uncharacterized protein YjbI with pentapeptide repeats